MKSSLTKLMVPKRNTKHNGTVGNYFSNGNLVVRTAAWAVSGADLSSVVMAGERRILIMAKRMLRSGIAQGK